MIFGKKDGAEMRKCEECGSRSETSFKFCPQCGNNFVDVKKEKENFGLLGRDDFTEYEDEPANNFGMMDKLVNSMVNSMMKNIDKQFKAQFKDLGKDFEKAEVKALPNGIRIKISGPFAQQQIRKKQAAPKVERREVCESQLKRMGTLPRTKAKTSVKRLGNRVVYELTTPGVISAEDVFVSKLESGYEVKAIGDKKVYVNSVPINLPLKKYSILDNKLSFEFVVDGFAQE